MTRHQSVFEFSYWWQSTVTSHKSVYYWDGAWCSSGLYTHLYTQTRWRNLWLLAIIPFSGDSFRKVYNNHPLRKSRGKFFRERFLFYTVHMQKISLNKICIHRSTKLLTQKLCNFLLYTIFVSSHMYHENPEGTRAIIGSMNMGMYPTLPGLKLAICSVPSARRFH